MSSLETLNQLEELRNLILKRATAAMDRSFAIGGITATPEQVRESELEMGKYTAYKIAGEELDKLIHQLKRDQIEEASA